MLKGATISTISPTTARAQLNARSAGGAVKRQKSFFRFVSGQRLHRFAIRLGFWCMNFILLAAVIGIVVLNPSGSHPAPQAVASAITAPNMPAVAQPVDQLASVDIALTVAQMTDLPEAGAVTSQANSARIQLAVAAENSEVVDKPQAITSTFVSRKDIHEYIAQPGDTVDSIATKFNVSRNSILWSNGLTGNQLAAGKKLYIPPVNGIVYTVRSGDTPASLASKYRSDADKITAYNDAEIGGLQVGEQILIPDGQIIVTAPALSGYGTGFAWGTSAIYGYNGYDWGNCTWYVATQIPVPANWGNAATWAAGARAAGWHVSSTPTVGAIAQNSWMAGGLGHVAIVDGISADGSQLLIRDMNGIAGFDRVGVAWESASLFQNFITR